MSGLILAFALVACGGGQSAGGGTSSGPPSLLGGEQVAAEEFTPNANSLGAVRTYESITVSTANSGTSIATTPVLRKAGGQVVDKIDDLPEGLANSDWMKATGSKLPLRVTLNPGVYRLARPWTWTPANSGTDAAPVTIEASTTGDVIFTGSRTISLPRTTHGGASTVALDLAQSSTGIFEQLWVNGQRATRARTPNAGSFHYVKRPLTTWAGQATVGDISADQQAFVGDSASLSYFNGLSAEEKAQAVLVAVHSWTTSHHRIAEVNANTDVRVTPPSRWAFQRFGTYQRYFIENIPSALDAAGEWYLQPTTMRLSYMPTASEKTADITFDAPVQTQLLAVQGQPSIGKWVENLHFKGIKFRYTSTPLPTAGLIDQQAAVDIGAAVQFSGARKMTLTDCEVSRVGGYAVWLKDNVRQVAVTGCEIFDTGAGGIRVGLPNQAVSATATGYNTVRNNRIHAIGFQFPGAVGIWVGQSAYNTIEENLIGDTTYSAISVGWNWGYVSSLANNNQVNRNFIYDVMQGSLSDGGGIYTLGVSPGTQIKGNVIKNVRGYNYYGSGAWGIYNDEGSSNILMDSNIVMDTDHGGYMLHYGANNTVSNNVFAGGRLAEIQIAKSEANPQVSFVGNRLLPTLVPFLSYGMPSPGPLATYLGNTISTQYVNGVQPGGCGSASACVNSDTLRIAVADKFAVPVVTDAAGTVSLPNPVASSWVGVNLTPTVSASPLWAKSRGFTFDAATADLGTWPIGFKVVPLDRPELASVIRNSSGEKCLGFQDSPTQAARWEPYGYIDADYPTGTTTASFTIKADAATEFIHEWRDPVSASTYLTGPSVTFSGARGVVVRNAVVAPLPVGEWVTVTITSTQGSSPTWRMQLKYANGTTRDITGQAPISDAWARTRSFYFISNATQVSTPCIGKWTITNTQ